MKIIAPNEKYNGVSASVKFKNGVGETDNPQLIKWFKARGYTIEGKTHKPKKPNFDDMTKKELRKYAEENNIDIPIRYNKEEMIAKIKGE